MSLLKIFSVFLFSLALKVAPASMRVLCFPVAGSNATVCHSVDVYCHFLGCRIDQYCAFQFGHSNHECIDKHSNDVLVCAGGDKKPKCPSDSRFRGRMQNCVICESLSDSGHNFINLENFAKNRPLVLGSHGSDGDVLPPPGLPVRGEDSGSATGSRAPIAAAPAPLAKDSKRFTENFPPVSDRFDGQHSSGAESEARAFVSAPDSHLHRFEEPNVVRSNFKVISPPSPPVTSSGVVAPPAPPSQISLKQSTFAVPFAVSPPAPPKFATAFSQNSDAVSENTESKNLPSEPINDSSNTLSKKQKHSTNIRELLFEDDETTEQKETVSESQRACVSLYMGNGEFRDKCLNIDGICNKMSCLPHQLCAVDLQGDVQCFPNTLRSFQNCANEDSRLRQPCPADAGIVAFGQGCTFCDGTRLFFNP